jgi:hypothetical protein
MCVRARGALASVEDHVAAVHKMDKTVDGIGKNHLTEKARFAGIQAYSDCIHMYAVRGLLAEAKRQSLEQLMLNLESHIAPSLSTFPNKAEGASWPPLPWEQDDDEALLWSHQLSILKAEFPVSSDAVSWITELLQKLVLLQNDYAKRVYDCKKRDDVRGTQTVPGYKDSHVAAEDDAVIKAIRAEAASVAKGVEEVMTLFAYDSTRLTRSRL